VASQSTGSGLLVQGCRSKIIKLTGFEKKIIKLDKNKWHFSSKNRKFCQNSDKKICSPKKRLHQFSDLFSRRKSVFFKKRFSPFLDRIFSKKLLFLRNKVYFWPRRTGKKSLNFTIKSPNDFKNH